MPKTSHPIKIFLSHSANDGDLIDAFESLLTVALNITSASIFCSSLEGQGVRKGGQFVEDIKQKAIEAEAVVALISPAYMESAFCLAELGAAWVLNTERFPVVVPPTTFQDVNATLLGVVAVKIDDEAALTQLIEDIGVALELSPPSGAVRLRAIRKFMELWPDLKGTIGKAKRVDAIVHEKALDDLKTSRQVWKDTEAELKVANAKFAALLKTKNREEAKDALKQFENSNWEMDFDSAVSAVSEIASEVGGPRILKLMILELLGLPAVPEHGEDNVQRVVQIGVYDPESREWNRSTEEMKKLRRAMKNVTNYLDKNSDAIEALTLDKKRTDTSDIRFWEQHAELPIA